MKNCEKCFFSKKIFSLTRETAGVCARCARRLCILINFEKIHQKIFRALRAQRALHYSIDKKNFFHKKRDICLLTNCFFISSFIFVLWGKYNRKLKQTSPIIILVSGSNFIFDPFGRERLSFSKAKSDHPNFFCKNQFSDFKADVLQWR